MSRIGRKPVPIPSGVKVSVSGRSISAEGPKGKLSLELASPISVKVEEKVLVLQRDAESKKARALHGLFRSLVANMVRGVSEGYQKGLEISGVGYGVKVAGNKLILSLGFSQPAEVGIPEGLSVEAPTATKFYIRGADKQQVGEFAAEVRRLRPPEPFKGKGIRYEGEVIRRKAGKAVAGAGVAGK